MRRLLGCILGVAACSGVCLASGATLIDAIKDQDHKTVAALIKSHADVNAALPDGSTPLAWATYEDDAEMVDLLLQSGAKTNAANQYGETPLTLACEVANPGIVEKLLKAGADARAARASGETALMIAAGTGNSRILKMLIEHGANVEAVESRKGQNALMWAAAGGYSEAVQTLTAASANPNAASKGGFTPLILAAGQSDPKTVAALLAAGADIKYAVGGATPLSIAVSSRKMAVVDVLIANGADPTAKDAAGSTVLHTAAQLGDLDLVTKLIAKHVDVNAKTAETGGRGGRLGPAGGQTPLMLAAKGNHLEVMHALVAAGADPKLTAQDGSTLLMAAAGSGHVEVVQYAYDLNPDVKAVTTRKQAVMHSAVTGTLQASTQAEICKVVQFLADKGADLDPVDATGRTPIAIANVIPIDNAVTLLLKLIKASGAAPHDAGVR
jgi:uncharacterized protein